MLALLTEDNVLSRIEGFKSTLDFVYGYATAKGLTLKKLQRIYKTNRDTLPEVIIKFFDVVKELNITLGK